MLFVRLRSSALGVQSFYAHHSHQPLYPFTIDMQAMIIPQVIPQLARSLERVPQMQFVEPSHQAQVLTLINRF